MKQGKGFAMSTDQGPCPCGGGAYRTCCAPLHRGDQRAETAEQLMRSRYSAFVKGELDYLLLTHPEAHLPEAERRHQLRRSFRATRWVGLRILSCTDGGVGDVMGTVVFEARHSEGVLRETSFFQRRGGGTDGDWQYIKALDMPQTARN